MLKKIVDGGYLSWVYGCKPGATISWATMRGFYTQRAGVLVLMDSVSSTRKIYNSTYKAKRQTNRDVDPVKQEKYDMVRAFQQEHLRDNPHVRTHSAEGLEADDLVAVVLHYYSHHFKSPLHLIGVDKDLWQLPWDRFRMTTINDQSAKLTSVLKKFPRYITPLITSPKSILLGLSLFGDRSDSIPKLATRKIEIEVVSDIFLSRKPFLEAYQEFGSNFLDNLYSAILPNPWVYQYRPNPLRVMKMVDNDSYWDLKTNPLEADFQISLQQVLDEYPNKVG